MDTVSKIGFGIVIVVIGFCKLLSRYVSVKEEEVYKPVGNRMSIWFTPGTDFQIQERKNTDTNTPNL